MSQIETKAPLDEAHIEPQVEQPQAAPSQGKRKEFKRRFEIYRDGLLYEVVSYAIDAISNHVSMLANREPHFRWEARPLERRRIPDRRFYGNTFVIDRRPDGGALVL